MTHMNLWCVGRNYADHAKELGNKVPATPMIFLKAGSSIGNPETPLLWPASLGVIHHETELAVELDSRFKPSRAAVALDFTARDTQNQLKSQGHPWTLAKSFQNACGLGPLQPVHDWSTLQRQGEIRLWVNGEIKQHGSLRDMIFSVEQLIDYIASVFPVRPGDLILTGTPAGVGPLQSGDRLRAEITGLPTAQWQVV